MTLRKAPEQHSHKTGTAGTQSEEGGFTRVLTVDTVHDTGLEISICADAAECAAVAEEVALVAIHSLAADFLVLKQDGSRLKVNGVLRAEVTQTCVISLEPFDTEIRADFSVNFAPAQRDIEAGGGVLLAGDLEAADPIIDGRIDLGALAVEFLVLNLDIYPRKPGVSFEGAEFSGDARGKNSPFAVLQNLKTKP
jgi:uncharacterized metal-binding protein YceD (DUF177 family)